MTDALQPADDSRPFISLALPYAKLARHITAMYEIVRLAPTNDPSAPGNPSAGLSPRDRSEITKHLRECLDMIATIDIDPTTLNPYPNTPEGYIVIQAPEGARLTPFPSAPEQRGALEYVSRSEVRAAIEPALLENRVIFQDYGPDNEYRLNPESEMAVTWKRKMLSTIIPNNRKILLILDANRRHLLSAELQTLEIFRQHVDDLEDRHIGEGVKGIGRRFPEEMNTIAT